MDLGAEVKREPWETEMGAPVREERGSESRAAWRLGGHRRRSEFLLKVRVLGVPGHTV